MGRRPDRAVIVYCNRIREAYGDVPIILGGLEASLRRFAHYDYWDDKVRRSILVDSRADILTYGMGENILRRIAALLDKGVPVKKIQDVRGTVYLTSRDAKPHYEVAGAWDYDELKTDKRLYAEAFGVQYRNTDAITGKALVEYYDNKMLVQNPPMPPLEREELDAVYALPYMRRPHPCYDKDGGVPAIAEVEMSITHNRGCFGACNFCALAFHQGRTVRSRSIESVVREAKIITESPNFKGYINDIGASRPRTSATRRAKSSSRAASARTGSVSRRRRARILSPITPSISSSCGGSRAFRASRRCSYAREYALTICSPTRMRAFSRSSCATMSADS